MENNGEMYLPIFAPYEIVNYGGQECIIGGMLKPPVYKDFMSLKKMEVLNRCRKLDLNKREEILKFCNDFGLPAVSDYTRDDYFESLTWDEYMRRIKKKEEIIAFNNKFFGKDGDKGLFDIALENLINTGADSFRFRKADAFFLQTLSSFKRDIERINSITPRLEKIYGSDGWKFKLSMTGIAGDITILLKKVGLQVNTKYEDFLKEDQEARFFESYNYDRLGQVAGIRLNKIAMDTVVSDNPKKRGAGLKVCKKENCQKLFEPSRPNEDYCSKHCRGAFNSKNSREKEKRGLFKRQRFLYKYRELEKIWKKGSLIVRRFTYPLLPGISGMGTYIYIEEKKAKQGRAKQ